MDKNEPEDYDGYVDYITGRSSGLEEEEESPEYGIPWTTYHAYTDTTAVYPGKGEILGLLYIALGLAGEAGEVAGEVKKILRDDDGRLTPQRFGRIVKELGDLSWYLSQMFTELKVVPESVWAANVEKLEQRVATDTVRGDHGGTEDEYDRIQVHEDGLVTHSVITKPGPAATGEWEHILEISGGVGEFKLEHYECDGECRVHDHFISWHARKNEVGSGWPTMPGRYGVQLVKVGEGAEERDVAALTPVTKDSERDMDPSCLEGWPWPVDRAPASAPQPVTEAEFLGYVIAENAFNAAQVQADVQKGATAAVRDFMDRSLGRHGGMFLSGEKRAEEGDEVLGYRVKFTPQLGQFAGKDIRRTVRCDSADEAWERLKGVYGESSVRYESWPITSSK